MNRRTILFTMVVATAIVLLAGCQEGSHPSARLKNHDGLPLTPSQRGKGERIEAKPDSVKEDSMKTFYKLIPRKERIRGGMGRSESDK